ncbi:DNA (cytosine-5-)-methyltransferase [Yoonia sp. I 8.24]|uniref:DNA (cytosine-5-)-methyltransferase n=1 Tax=Yoonia sp. I 8.24 TaxID=1537229 RepID=UPI001EE05ADD|nr:DNA (cytosine-5-)-methyltransferase [Yoonia sp. I 8.24]MCG3267154.1 DNA (cytosine-5-)-methyltransferase [Yoonia sp. I 8.24]
MSEFSRLRLEAGLSIPEAVEALGYCERTLYRWENGDAQPRKAAIEFLKKAVGGKEKPEGSFSFIDLFAGIGGLRLGFEEIGGKCVFTSEWDRFSVETYLANHKCDHKVAGDITKVDVEEIPSHDVLLAGFPCQPFSLAGVSKKNSLGREHGFRCDAQGTLFFDVARIIEHHRPRAFLLENVKNLLSHDKGRTFEVIKRTLTEELGYTIDFKVIDAKAFVPQHRERIFIVGFRAECGFSFDDLELPEVSKGPRMRTILHPEDGPQEAGDKHFTDELGNVSSKYFLSDKLWNYLQAYAEKHRLKGNGFGFGMVTPDDTCRTLSARYHKDGSEILISRGSKNPRRLTPRECARLMGFEKPGKSAFKIPVSDTQAYRQFGNAVVVPVVAAIARHMAPYILNETQEQIYQEMLLRENGMLASETA